MDDRRTQMMAPNGSFVSVRIRSDAQYHYLSDGFSLKDEFKVMQGAKWLGYEKTNPTKEWRVHNNSRNNFVLQYLEGNNPYQHYKSDLNTTFKTLGIELPTHRTNIYGESKKIYEHQTDMAKHILVRKQCIVAGEMGVGKTLSVFTAMEAASALMAWYVAPKGVLTAIRAEMRRWKLRTPLVLMTYDELKKKLANWVPGEKPPRFVVFDESSKLKNWSSQRTQAAFYLSEEMRKAYGLDCYIVLMSGSPAPKSPEDWWAQCEIARPGYIREGDIYKFRDRYAVVVEMKDGVGSSYKKIQCWKDGNPEICKCGFKKAAHVVGEMDHMIADLPDEIGSLHKRLSGLVMVKMKKDCLDLPQKIFRRIRIKPSMDMLRAAKIILASSKSTIEGLIKLRELSDGFQYREIKKKIPCRSCYPATQGECDICAKTGFENQFVTEITEVDSPKLKVVTDILDEVEDVGRIVIGAGFTASIDRLCKHVKEQGWEFIRLDGRGWNSSLGDYSPDQLYKIFQEDYGEKKIAMICHPGSGGMGLTFTRSPIILCVSNDYNGESRIQFIDRGHRPGMDVERGCTIIDLCLLPSDTKILDNLDRKVELQSISLGDFAANLEAVNAEEHYDA